MLHEQVPGCRSSTSHYPCFLSSHRVVMAVMFTYSGGCASDAHIRSTDLRILPQSASVRQRTQVRASNKKSLIVFFHVSVRFRFCHVTDDCGATTNEFSALLPTCFILSLCFVFVKSGRSSDRLSAKSATFLHCSSFGFSVTCLDLVYGLVLLQRRGACGQASRVTPL